MEKQETIGEMIVRLEKGFKAGFEVDSLSVLEQEMDYAEEVLEKIGEDGRLALFRKDREAWAKG